MSREIRRVPTDFAWPLKTVWGGYLTPERFREADCPDCTAGYSPMAQHLGDRWYGSVPFNPAETGSTPLTVRTPAVRELAERHVCFSPEYYGFGEAAIVREAQRVADMWNGQWCHHLAQVDVDALVAGGRLWTFTRVPRDDRQRDDVRKKVAGGGNSWLPYDNGYCPTAAEVNEWSIRSTGHDAINRSIVIRAACDRAGVPATCETCAGHATLEVYPGQRAECEAWAEEDHGPPTGDGWQVWETTSEGSPISPVFPDQEGLIGFLMSDAYYGFGTSPTPLTREQAEAFVGAGSSLGTMVTVGGRIIAGDAAAHELGRGRADD